MSSIGWINEARESLLLLGSDDGVVRVWNGILETAIRDEAGVRPPRLVTAFSAAPVSAFWGNDWERGGEKTLLFWCGTVGVRTGPACCVLAQ